MIVEVKAVHCPEIMPRRGLVLSTTATQMGTKVHFSCNNGNALIGTPEIVCRGIKKSSQFCILLINEFFLQPVAIGVE